MKGGGAVVFEQKLQDQGMQNNSLTDYELLRLRPILIQGG